MFSLGSFQAVQVLRFPVLIALVGLLSLMLGCKQPEKDPEDSGSSISLVGYAYVARNDSLFQFNRFSDGSLSSMSPSSVSIGASAAGGVVVHPNKRFLYTTAPGLDLVLMFEIGSSTGALSALSPATISAQDWPNYLAMDPQGRFLYVANYSSNTISMYTINSSTGQLTATTPATIATNTPLTLGVESTGKFAYVVNNGSGTVSMFSINQSTGVLTATTPATVATDVGPSKIAFSPSGNFAYVSNADTNGNEEISMYSLNSSTGILTPLSPAAAYNGYLPMFFGVHPILGFAYASGRTNICLYGFNSDTGNLSGPNSCLSTSHENHHFAIDSTGKYFYVSSALDDVINTYSIDQNSGNLTQIGTPIYLLGDSEIVLVDK